MDVINLYGGPGCGKSTLAAATFAYLKRLGYNAELMREPFKAGIWDGYRAGLEDAVWIAGTIYHELMQYKRGGVDVVVSDCPLLLGRIYAQPEDSTLKLYLLELYSRFRNVDVLVQRSLTQEYSKDGRVHELWQALNMDQLIQRDMGAVFAVPSQEADLQHTAGRVIGEYERRLRLWQR